jgi:GST-like protein
VAVDDLTIADIAIWPWVSRYQFQKINLHDYPNVLDWYLRLAQRPAFQAGYKVPDSTQEILMPNG